MVAKVAFSLAINKLFDYQVPSNFENAIKPFQRVAVEFNNKKRWGIIVELRKSSERKEIKPILEILDKEAILDEFDLKFAKKISENYFVSLGEALELFIPPYLRKIKNNQEEIKSIPLEKNKFKMKIILKEDEELFKQLEFKINRLLHQSKQVLILVPLYLDVLKWKAILEKFKEKIAILSSKQTSKDFFKEWLRIKNHQAQIILGTRIAIFCPARKLNLIIVNREYSDFFKQKEKPFYNLRDLAILRAQLEEEELLFGSNIPSLEIFKFLEDRKEKQEKVVFIEKKKKVYFIEKKRYQSVRKSILNPFIDALLRNYLENNEKVILLFNKAGYARSVYCKVCGNILKCQRCGVGLVYHFESKELSCHQCGKRYSFKEECPKCGSSFVRFSGWGIEKLEKEFNRLFVNKKIIRIDKEEKEISKEWDIILSTQAIYNYNLTASLFIILDIDSFLNFQDFRNAEKVVRILYESLKRTEKELVVLTSAPDFYPFKFFREFDLRGFYEKEEILRRESGLPPFGHIGIIRFRAKRSKTSLKKTEEFYEFFKEKYPEIELFYPSTPFPFKLREQFRWQILLKSQDIKMLRKAISEAVSRIKPSTVKISIEVDLE